jgi:choline monooxygenase
VSAHAYGQASRAFSPSVSVDGKSAPEIPNYPAHLHGHGEYPLLFPNLLLGTQATEFFAVSCEPIAPNLTRERFYVFFPEAAMDEKFAAVRERTLARWFQVNTEDIEVVERIQRGRAYAARDGDIFAPGLDACVHLFVKQVAASVLEGKEQSDVQGHKSPRAAE